MSGRHSCEHRDLPSFPTRRSSDLEPNRDYWTGLFAHGFGLCGTTHAQYCAEIDELLGHCRSRCVGVTGHNSVERSEEHTSERQSHSDIECRLPPENKKSTTRRFTT